MAQPPLSCAMQLRLLQLAVAVLSLVPIGAGLAGSLYGIAVFEPASSLGHDTDSTGRYLSGLLFAIGLGFWTTVPRIEAQGARFRLLTLLVFTGGLARLAGLFLVGLPSAAMLGGLVMELLVAPALALWRERLERLCGGACRAAPPPAERAPIPGAGCYSCRARAQGGHAMDMTGEERIAAGREAVWAALNDVDVLKRCIPGCESLEKQSPTDMAARVKLQIGPVRATFSGKVKLSDLDPPNGYRISGEGNGGVAGFAKGGAVVRLQDDGAGTLLRYEAKADVGGKLAQLGGRLIDSTARKLAGEFFEKFAAVVASESTGAPPPHASTAKKEGWLRRLLRRWFGRKEGPGTSA